MPTKTYARKTKTGGGLCGPTQGYPSLVAGITLAGRSWHVVADATQVHIKADGDDYTGAEDTELDAAYAAWEPDEPLATYKTRIYKSVCDEHDRRCASLTFEYPPASGNLYDASGTTPTAAPFDVTTADGLAGMTLADGAAVTAYQAAREAVIASCWTDYQTVCAALRAAADVAGVDSAVASYLSGA